MKAISLWQPWATLVAIGAKRFETRSWPTGYRGSLAIHAALRWTDQQIQLCRTEPFFSALVGEWPEFTLPLGSIVAVCELTGCFSTDDERFADSFPNLHLPHEYAFGDWSPGRYAWRLENVRRVPQPLPCRGHQGFFEVADPLTPALSPGGGRHLGLSPSCWREEALNRG